ncbi:hypothetical protein [Planktosalinus lacus]|uniref:Uncharacterized protein n=1 Tax=Planktosalinus lacus TaxID=1526573 RepID=A0A8J2VFJ2_9FLAO|nr:hypothetical protein [Planktosalinus lacus]GGE02051.1 hypothetical protein GCM10011312_26780 [Planktosalinus lacus]
MHLKKSTIGLISLSLLITGMNSCNSKNDHFILYPKDQTQAITVITEGHTRFIIDGEHNQIPEENFIKIDISKIDRIGDEIGVCWNNGNFEWEVVNHGSRILENKLDTTRFKFNTSWDVDPRGIPNSTKYHQEMCGTTGTEYFSPRNGDNLLYEQK